MKEYLLKRALPFMLTFAVGAAVGGFFQLFSARGCHLPRQKGAEVCWTLAAILRTGLEEGMKPMMRIEPPKQDGLDHAKHHGCQVGAPHAA